MALHMRLMLNGQRIGHLEVQRLAPNYPSADDLCTYRWRVEINDEVYASEPVPLVHRYGDGAWALVARVIEAAGLGRQVPMLAATGNNPGDQPRHSCCEGLDPACAHGGAP